MAAEDAHLERIIERYLLRESLLKASSLPNEKKKTKKDENKKYQPNYKESLLKASSSPHEKKKKKKTKKDENKKNNN
jgi:hypothetical protein